MSHFIITELFKQFMSEGFGTNLARQKVREQTKLSVATIKRVVRESDECQEIIQQRIKDSQNNMRFLQQGVTP